LVTSAALGAVKSFRLGRLQHNKHKEMATNYINHR
jgi:hypothetical protein